MRWRPAPTYPKKQGRVMLSIIESRSFGGIHLQASRCCGLSEGSATLTASPCAGLTPPHPNLSQADRLFLPVTCALLGLIYLVAVFVPGIWVVLSLVGSAASTFMVGADACVSFLPLVRPTFCTAPPLFVQRRDCHALTQLMPCIPPSPCRALCSLAWSSLQLRCVALGWRILRLQLLLCLHAAAVAALDVHCGLFSL